MRETDDQTAPAAPAPLGPLVADEALQTDSSDVDSALGMGTEQGGSTRSIQSSILRYREEHGRRYHGYKSGIGYVMPNDELEQDRLDLQHHLLQLTFDGNLVLCPAGQRRHIGRVLDIGTGTGAWAVDFADEHPEAEVIGVDISPIQPYYVPPNVSFQIADMEDPWTFTRPFDLILCRMMTGSISDFASLVQKSYDHLLPGAWLELQDVIFPPRSDDDTLPPSSPIARWGTLILEATRLNARPADSALTYRALLSSSGFVNVRQAEYKWPLNAWPKETRFKEMGICTYENIAENLPALSLVLFTRVLGWKARDVEVFLNEVRAAMADPRVHAYLPIGPNRLERASGIIYSMLRRDVKDT